MSGVFEGRHGYGSHVSRCSIQNVRRAPTAILRFFSVAALMCFRSESVHASGLASPQGKVFDDAPPMKDKRYSLTAYPD